MEKRNKNKHYSPIKAKYYFEVLACLRNTFSKTPLGENLITLVTIASCEKA
jgi:hypothetical protein